MAPSHQHPHTSTLTLAPSHQHPHTSTLTLAHSHQHPHTSTLTPAPSHQHPHTSTLYQHPHTSTLPLACLSHAVSCQMQSVSVLLQKSSTSFPHSRCTEQPPLHMHSQQGLSFVSPLSSPLLPSPSLSSLPLPSSSVPELQCTHQPCVAGEGSAGVLLSASRDTKGPTSDSPSGMGMGIGLLLKCDRPAPPTHSAPVYSPTSSLTPPPLPSSLPLPALCWCTQCRGPPLI